MKLHIYNIYIGEYKTASHPMAIGSTKKSSAAADNLKNLRMKIMRLKRNLFYSLGVFLLSYAPSVAKAQQSDTLDLGYKKVSVADFNGSAYTITAHELRNLPVTNLTNLLSGLVPGFFLFKPLAEQLTKLLTIG
ncbi:hypothetical protein [Niabella ginsengisoli]|uniref:Uncharacterized protein n=1 Tax=Niabella ginsengisoli TaxID=522298 RepID=A0ABS9SKS5_9BACT|nr:hypothetical protein [Niabella ginsengisoli]MCH5598968.1 hypothetical protein [Niabella ginsengisoli]